MNQVILPMAASYGSRHVVKGVVCLGLVCCSLKVWLLQLLEPVLCDPVVKIFEVATAVATDAAMQLQPEATWMQTIRQAEATWDLTVLTVVTHNDEGTMDSCMLYLHAQLT